MKKVLVAEDNKLLLKTCCRFLAASNYSVTPCASAAEAARQLETGEYSLLLTDFHLGDGTANDLIPLMKSKNPSARAVIMSGDPRLAGTRGPGPAYADTETLMKPFRMDTLLEYMAKAARA